MQPIDHDYDLERFVSHKPKLIALKKSPKEQKRRKKQAKQQRILNISVLFSIVLAISILIGHVLTNQVKITELNCVIAEKDKQITIMESEQVRLQAEITALGSPEKLRAYAEAQGLLDTSGMQVYYIVAHDKDDVQIMQKSNWFTRLWEKIFH